MRVCHSFRAMRGRAVGAGWRPRTLYQKGDITRRQFAAACELATLFEAGFVAPIKGAKITDRVSGGASAPAPDGMLDGAVKYRRAMGRLCESQRLIVKAVCVDGATMTALAGDIISHRGDKRLFWDRKNWQSLCETCHNKKTGSGQ
jgi:hypothetical protein